jgi:hypothetical protein
MSLVRGSPFDKLRTSAVQKRDAMETSGNCPRVLFEAIDVDIAVFRH